MLLYYGHNLLFCKFGILFDNFYSSYLIIYNGFSIFIYVTINPSTLLSRKSGQVGL